VTSIQCFAPGAKQIVKVMPRCRFSVLAGLLLLVLGDGAVAQMPPDAAVEPPPTPQPNGMPNGGMGDMSHFVVRGERAPDAPRPDNQVLETRPPNNLAEKPAFAGQTRAVSIHSKTEIEAKVIAHGLSQPWGLAFLPDGRILTTEKSGSMRLVTTDGTIGPKIEGVPKVVFRSDAGLLDVVIDAGFADNRAIYFTYIEPRDRANGMVVARATLSTDGSSLLEVKTLLNLPSAFNTEHYGGRLLIGPDRKLYIGSGERFLASTRIQAQSLNSPFGKILRMNTDGSIPTDNPFAGTSGAFPFIYSYGHRIVQGLTFNPATGQLWSTEHGQQGGDELNIVLPGSNYGWPLAAYGVEYTGAPINGGKTQWPGTTQPIYFWDPAIAPSGTTFYTGNLIPEWRGDVFVAALAGQHLAHLRIKGDRVVGEERLLQDQHQRIRDVAQGPDGALWVLTDNPDGRLIRIAPRGK
jgi:aldose sugar dehydrogenase